MPNDYNIERFRRPEIFLSELIKKSARNELLSSEDNVPVLFRAIVLDVDVEGGKLENIDGAGNANIGPINPKNSIKARIITNSLDEYTTDNDLRVFWPFFPEHFSIPIKPGEHVYIMFEDRDFEHGLWICKIPGHENLNFFKGESAFITDDTEQLNDNYTDTKKNKTKIKYITDIDAGEAISVNSLNDNFNGK